MSYASLEDMIRRYGRPELIAVTDREEDATGEIDEAKVTEALNAADAEINSYLAKQVSVPISPVPDQVKDVAITIARYKLYVSHVPDHVQAAYDRAVAWLRRAAVGDVSLGNGATPTTPASGGMAEFIAPDRTFNRSSLKDA